jgi:hypothetical protein
MRKGDHKMTNLYFRRRLYAQSFTIAVLVVGNLYWQKDRVKRKDYEKLVAEKERMDKRDRWLRELEMRDEEDKAWKDRMARPYVEENETMTTSFESLLVCPPREIWWGHCFARVATNAGSGRFNHRSLGILSDAVTIGGMGVNGILENGLHLCGQFPSCVTTVRSTLQARCMRDTCSLFPDTETHANGGRKRLAMHM